MKPSHIEHIGIAVKNLDDAIPFLQNFLDKNVTPLKKLKIRK